ncbi:MAG: T9SS type A sorting domain-containing protein [Paludibacteraceae bacterium]|nr:T9SS type A sorting domain-containing protein [Paludibacteraceae bacterium]
MLQSAQTDIDVSALPQGMYILCTETTSGTPLQAKFIKQ